MHAFTHTNFLVKLIKIGLTPWDTFKNHNNDQLNDVLKFLNWALQLDCGLYSLDHGKEIKLNPQQSSVITRNTKLKSPSLDETLLNWLDLRELDNCSSVGCNTRSVLGLAISRLRATAEWSTVQVWPGQGWAESLAWPGHTALAAGCDGGCGDCTILMLLSSHSQMSSLKHPPSRSHRHNRS